MVVVLQVPIEHRGIGAQAELMGRAMDLDPAAGVGLVLADLIADFGMKDLGAAAWQAPQACIAQLGEHFANRAASEMREPIDFHGRPGLQMQPRIRFMQQPEQIEIPIELLLMVQPADDVHLRRPAVDRLLPAGENLLVAHQVALGIAEIGAERAEDATVDADVRRVEVRVDVVIGRVAVLPLANEVGQLAQFV